MVKLPVGTAIRNSFLRKKMMSYWNNKDPNDLTMLVLVVIFIGVIIWAQYG